MSEQLEVSHNLNAREYEDKVVRDWDEFGQFGDTPDARKISEAPICSPFNSNTIIR
jgi:hypothetical protein